MDEMQETLRCARFSIQYLEHLFNHNSTRVGTTRAERERILRRHKHLTQILAEQRFRYEVVKEMLETATAQAVWTPGIMRDVRIVLEGISRDSFEMLDRQMRVLLAECSSFNAKDEIELPPDAPITPLELPPDAPTHQPVKKSATRAGALPL